MTSSNGENKFQHELLILLANEIKTNKKSATVRKCAVCRKHFRDAYVKGHQCPFKDCHCKRCINVKILREKARKPLSHRIRKTKTSVSAIKTDEVVMKKDEKKQDSKLFI